MKVLKFGGTSVGSPQRMKEVFQIIQRIEGPCMLVLSAVAGTTNSLVEIADLAMKGKYDDSFRVISSLEEKYTPWIDELYDSEEMRSDGNKVLNSTFATLRGLIDTPFNIVRDKEILSVGEMLSTKLFHLYLVEQRKRVKWLSALDFMRTFEGEPDLKEIDKKLSQLVDNQEQIDFYLTQGFICKNEHGEVDNLKRGGSDYTASILGAVMDADEIQIWTDIDGIHNNDPRIVAGTRPIKRMSFDEAAEMAYFGAKVLHPSTVHPAKQKNIPVRLLNTMAPDAPGTLISSGTDQTTSHVKAIAAKDGITAINIRSHRMLMAHGFLRKIFEIFERHKTSIDMITTSEVAVSVTIDDATRIDKITAELTEFSKVLIDSDQSIVCVVGEFRRNQTGLAVRVLENLRDIPIRMISSGGSESNISVLIDTSDKERTLKSLHEGLFSDT